MSGRQYLDNSDNDKPDQLPQTGETIDAKNVAHVKVVQGDSSEEDAFTRDKDVFNLLLGIHCELTKIRKHQELMTGEKI